MNVDRDRLHRALNPKTVVVVGDKAAARRVDDIGALRQFGEKRTIDDAAGIGRQR